MSCTDAVALASALLQSMQYTDSYDGLTTLSNHTDQPAGHQPHGAPIAYIVNPLVQATTQRPCQRAAQEPTCVHPTSRRHQVMPYQQQAVVQHGSPLQQQRADPHRLPTGDLEQLLQPSMLPNAHTAQRKDVPAHVQDPGKQGNPVTPTPAAFLPLSQGKLGTADGVGGLHDPREFLRDDVTRGPNDRFAGNPPTFKVAVCRASHAIKPPHGS